MASFTCSRILQAISVLVSYPELINHLRDTQRRLEVVKNCCYLIKRQGSSESGAQDGSKQFPALTF